MISCIHTHSGPWASGRLDIEGIESGVPQPHEYIEQTVAAIARLIEDARADAFPAQICADVTVCGAESGIGGNRRIAGGPHDPLVSVIAVRDMEKKVRGMFVNYTLHPTFIHEWSTVCTADYVGYLRQELTEQEDGLVVCFGQGASGNQSSRYYRKGESYDEAERVGRTLGKAARSVLEKAEWKDEAPIRIASDAIPLELRSFGTEEELTAQVARDKAVYEEMQKKYGQSENREEYYKVQNANLKLLGSEDQLGYVLMQNRGTKIELLQDESPAELTAAAIGDICVVGAPGEIFVEYALYVKAMAGFRMVVFNELTGGCLPGYVYTPESLRTGGYETDTSMLAEGFGRHMTQKILELTQKVR